MIDASKLGRGSASYAARRHHTRYESTAAECRGANTTRRARLNARGLFKRLRETRAMREKRERWRTESAFIVISPSIANGIAESEYIRDV